MIRRINTGIRGPSSNKIVLNNAESNNPQAHRNECPLKTFLADYKSMRLRMDTSINPIPILNAPTVSTVLARTK